MAFVEVLERTRPVMVTKSARERWRERTGTQAKPQDLIEDNTITAIENKADLWLGGHDVRHGDNNSGVYKKLARRRSLEVIRQIDKTAEIRYYNIYYTVPEGTVSFRSERKIDDSANVEINATTGVSHIARQTEGTAMLKLMQQAEKYQAGQEKKKKVKDSLAKVIPLFQR